MRSATAIAFPDGAGAVAPPRVLVIDDEAAILRFFRAALAATYEVLTALTPEEGLRILETQDVELLFVDKNLPGMDGIEFLRRARAQASRFEAIVMTGYPSLDSAIEAVDLGVFRYLEKPVDLDDVLRAAAQAIERLRDRQRRENEFNDAVDQLLLSERRRGVAERLATIGQMAATLTHEIANPLCYLEACLSGLQESFEVVSTPARDHLATDVNAVLGPRLAEALDDIPLLLGDASDAAARLNRLVREVRGMCRPIDRRGEIDLAAVIQDALRITAKRVPSHVRVTVQTGEAPRVCADGVKLAQVIANLVANAADAMTDCTGRPGCITIRAGRDGDHATVEVRDNGAGIEPTARELLFTPFFTTKGEHGTGIGLSVCRDIIRAHGGRIDVESEPGLGACFTVRIPLRAPTDEVAADGPARILWVDGDRRLLAVMLRALSERHHVVPATTAGEALAVLATDRRFDTILCEHGLPGAGHLVEEIRRLDPLLAEHIVFVTDGSAGEPVPGPTLTKPVALDDLEHLIAERRRKA